MCQLVDAVASAPPEAQQRMLADSTEESVVRLEAQKLLGRMSSAGHFFSRPLAGLSGLNQFATGARIADRFVIQRFIGAGGMGEVYEVFDELGQEHVALKFVLGVWVDSGGDGDCLGGLLRREVQVSRKIGHPNVVRIHDIGEHRGGAPGERNRLFFTMDLVQGCNLAQGLADKQVESANN